MGEKALTLDVDKFYKLTTHYLLLTTNSHFLHFRGAYLEGHSLLQDIN